MPAYQIGKYEVTRGEYRPFIEDRGYDSPRYWSEEGWEWKEKVGRKEPAQWAAEHEWVGRYGYWGSNGLWLMRHWGAIGRNVNLEGM